MKKLLEKYFLAIILVPLFILFVGSSYVRFFILEDFLVSYEVDCDPEEHSCFVGCEDEDCNTEYLFYIVEKQASTLIEQCGNSVVDCPSALSCLAQDGDSCSVTYCSQGDPNATCYEADEETLRYNNS